MGSSASVGVVRSTALCSGGGTLTLAFMSRFASVVPRHRLNARLTFSRSAAFANRMGPLSS